MLSHVLVPGALAFHLLATAKKAVKSNFWCHNVGLAPLLLLLGKLTKRVDAT